MGAGKIKSKAMLWMQFINAEFLGKPIEKVKFRVFDNSEVYVLNPDIVKAFLYRITPNVRARVMITIETGASAGEVWRLTWNNFNPQNKTLTIIGNKGH